MSGEMKGSAILFSEMVPEASWESEFNAWYDEEHIPDRMCLPGFISVQRYRNDGGAYLVIYEMDGLNTLTTPGYEKVKNEPSERTRWMLESVSGFTRNLGTLVGEWGVPDRAMTAQHVATAIMLDIPQSKIDAFDQWLRDGHLAGLIGPSRFDAARVFAMTVAEPVRFTRLVVLYGGEGADGSSSQSLRSELDEWNAIGEIRTFASLGPRVQADG